MSCRANLKAPFYVTSRLLSPFPAAFLFFPWEFALAHTQATLLAVAPQHSLEGSLLQHRFKPKLSIFTFEKLYKHSEKSQPAVDGTCLRKVRKTLVTFWEKRIKRSSKRKQHRKRELKKNRNILKVNATALKTLTFLESTCFCFSTEKHQFKLLHPIHISVTWSNPLPSSSFLMPDLSAVAIPAELMHLVQWIFSKLDLYPK